MSATPPHEHASSSARSAFATAALSVLGALGTGIGVLGFVTFVGGATWLARFRGVELSGTYAITAVPRSELIATGADQLLSPAVAAMLAVTLVLALLGLARWLRLERGTWTALVLVMVLAGAAGAVWYFADRVGSPFGYDAWVPFLGACTAYALGATVVVALARRAYPPDDARLGGAVAPTDVVALGVAVALTLLVYSAFETYALNMMRPHIRPAAVVAADGRGFAGYYVGQDGDTVYLGVVSPPLAHTTRPRSAARIVQVPLTDGARVAVGSTLAPFKARQLADDLLDELRTHDSAPR